MNLNSYIVKQHEVRIGKTRTKRMDRSNVVHTKNQYTTLNSCGRKKGYVIAEQAQADADALNRKKKVGPDSVAGVYTCSVCRLMHVGRYDKNERKSDQVVVTNQ